MICLFCGVLQSCSFLAVAISLVTIQRSMRMIYIKDEFVANDKKYRQVVPCGMLYSHCNRQYFLLNPYPLDEDWEMFERRFVVVPRSQVDQLDDAKVYPFARHIVTSSYTIE